MPLRWCTVSCNHHRQPRWRLNGIDFWREENGQFVENWVLVDMNYLFNHMGIDLLEHVKHMADQRVRAAGEDRWNAADNPPTQG